MMLARSTLVWLGILVLASANGALRQGVLIPRFGEGTGHVISTLLLTGAVVGAAWMTIGWIGADARECWAVGASWLLLTVAFEFLAGHYLFGAPWHVLLAEYDLTKGRIWPLVLVATLLGPVVMGRVRGL